MKTVIQILAAAIFCAIAICCGQTKKNNSTKTIDQLHRDFLDVMLDSTLESFEALKGYAVHPDHVAVADSAVRPYTKIRSCLDFEV